MNITAFFADNSTFHVVVWQFNCSDRALSSYLASHAFHRFDEDSLRPLLGVSFDVLLHFGNQIEQITLDVSFSHLHQLISGIFLLEASNFLKLFLLTRTNVTDLILQFFNFVLLLA